MEAGRPVDENERARLAPEGRKGGSSVPFPPNLKAKGKGGRYRRRPRSDRRPFDRVNGMDQSDELQSAINGWPQQKNPMDRRGAPLIV